MSITKKILLLLLIYIIAFSCKSDEVQNKECSFEDYEKIVGVWGNPRFISNSSNCYLNECIEMNFELGFDFSYNLSYTIYDEPSNDILRELNDQGTFEYQCLEKGQLTGKHSSLTYQNGIIILNSNTLTSREWELDMNGVEGMIIQPEYLDFEHDAYITLR
jgi:hypothetical protein